MCLELFFLSLCAWDLGVPLPTCWCMMYQFLLLLVLFCRSNWVLWVWNGVSHGVNGIGKASANSKGIYALRNKKTCRSSALLTWTCGILYQGGGAVLSVTYLWSVHGPMATSNVCTSLSLWPLDNKLTQHMLMLDLPAAKKISMLCFYLLFQIVLVFIC